MMHTTHPALCKIGGLRRKHEQQIHFSLQYTSKHWMPHLQQFWEVYTKGEQSYIEQLWDFLLTTCYLIDAYRSLTRRIAVERVLQFFQAETQQSFVQFGQVWKAWLLLRSRAMIRLPNLTASVIKHYTWPPKMTTLI